MHQLHLPNASATDRTATYQALLPQLEALLADETDWVATLANTTAALREAFGFFWVGFYRTQHSDQLVLAPFQGTVACTRIPFGKGVCGTAALRQQTIIVPDVEQFEGHIACSSLSRSEIVVPLVRKGKTILVLDIDSTALNDFSEIDTRYLQQIISLLDNVLPADF